MLKHPFFNGVALNMAYRNYTRRHPLASEDVESGPNLFARFDKRKEWVLCAVLDCGGQLARVLLRSAPSLVLPPGLTLPGRLLVFPPGWAMQRDGIWGLSGRAKDRIRRGQRPPLRMSHGFSHGLHEFEDLAYFPALPCLAICPRRHSVIPACSGFTKNP